MSKVKAIAAVDLDWGIGNDDQLVWKLPADLKRFKEMTMGGIIIMGSTTHTGLGRKLEGRVNVVVSSGLFITADRTVRGNPPDIIESFRSLDKDIWIIGGQNIYEQFLPLCDEIHLTRLRSKFKCNKYFPKSLLETVSTCRECSPVMEDNDIQFTYEIWRKI
jgi:dihydrofolate reductase